MKNPMHRAAAGWLLAALFLAAGFAGLTDYGVNWDEALGDLFFGQRYLSFFTSFDGRYLDFDGEPYPPGHRPDFSMSPFRRFPEQYFPFANTAAMAVATVLTRVMPLDVFDAFHAFNLLLGALFIAVFFRFLAARISAIAAAAAVVLLFTSPRVWYDAMVNVKDFPEMVLFSLAAIAYFVAWECSETRWYAIAGVAWGLAMATKANAIFFAFIVLAFELVTRRFDVRRLAVMAGVAAVTFFASWPWLWSDPIGRLTRNLEYIGIRTMNTPEAMTTSPLAMLLFTTTPAFLVLILAGLLLAVLRARRGSRLDLFLLVWIAVVIARLLVPGAANFDGVRHFLELFPPLAALAGASLQSLEWKRAAAIAAVAAIPGLVAIVAMHPFQNAYWNMLIGGTSGAHARKIPQAGEYWATSYRQGIEWLNRNAPRNTALAVPIAEQTVALVAPVRLRRDIELVRYAPPVPPYDPHRLPRLAARAQRQPVFVMFIRRDENGNELTRACLGSLRPVVAWKRDGVPLLEIYSLQGIGYRPQNTNAAPKSGVR